MDLGNELRKAKNFVSRRRGPDSYFQYKRKREDDRRVAREERERATDYAEQERTETERGREYEARYTADRADEVARKPTERSED
jgi:hypothetical protein